jgi:hypothetical protein
MKVLVTAGGAAMDWRPIRQKHAPQPVMAVSP